MLSGAVEACARAETAAADAGFRATVLPVAGAFHSPFMAPAAERLGEALGNTTVHPPRCPVYANVTASPHDAEQIRERLVEQLTAPVRWAESCAAMAGAHGGVAFHELAPGKTLAGLMRRIDRGTKVTTHDTPN